MKKTADHQMYKVEFNFFEKIKFKISKSFRNNANMIMSEYDYYRDIYVSNRRFFDELKEYSGFILGGRKLEESLIKIQEEPKKLKEFDEQRNVLKDLAKFYNKWNLARHKKFKFVNTIKISLKIQQYFNEGAKSIILIKMSKHTSIDVIEEQLKTFKNEKGIIYANKIFPDRSFQGPRQIIDGIVLSNSNSYTKMEISEIVLNDFSYFPTAKVISK